MNAPKDDFLKLAGRVLIAAVFLPSGVAKTAEFAGITAFIASKGLPLPELCAAGAIAIELVCGLALVLGWKVRAAAFALMAFTLVASLVFHAFWAMPAAQAVANQHAFFKNIAIIGGLLLLVASGPGRLRVFDSASEPDAMKAKA